MRDSPHFGVGGQSFHTFRSLSATVLLAGGLIKCEAVQRRPRAPGLGYHVQPRLDEKSLLSFSLSSVPFILQTLICPSLGERVGSKCGQRLLHVTLLR
jgi:hypothetical protein